MDASEQANGLLELADQLRGILVPVEPTAGYRQRVRSDLVLNAQAARRRATTPEPEQQGSLLAGAAIGLLASLIWITFALAVRSRRGRATRAA